MQEQRPRAALNASTLSFRRRAAFVGAAATITLVADQLTKAWAVNALADRNIELFWTFRFHLTHNTGIAFSMATGRGALVGLIAPVVAIGLLVAVRNEQSPRILLAAGAVFGGAFGNIADRLFRAGGPGLLGGGVVDFIDPGWWPVFNVADIAVVCGGIALALFGFGAPAASPSAADRDGAPMTEQTTEPTAEPT